MTGPRGADPRPIEFRYLGLGEHLADYRATLAEQRRVHALVASGELPAQVLFVEHAPVYTAGRRTLPQERPADGSEVIEVDRGGKITYHGPGQLVGYPIAFVPWKVGVVDYVRMLEEALIGLLADYGLQGIRVPGRTGVWLDKPQRKIAAIGIRVSHQTTLHGFALNVSDDLAAFQKIIPCGIDDAGVTSLGRELGETPPLLAVAQRLEPHLRAALKGRIAG